MMRNELRRYEMINLSLTHSLSHSRSFFRRISLSQSMEIVVETISERKRYGEDNRRNVAQKT